MNASFRSQLFIFLVLAGLSSHLKAQDILDVPASTTSTLHGTVELGSGNVGGNGQVIIETNAGLFIGDGTHLDDGQNQSGGNGGNGGLILSSGAALNFGNDSMVQIGGKGGNGFAGGDGVVTLAPSSTVDLSKTSGMSIGGNGGTGGNGGLIFGNGGAGGNGGLMVGSGSTLTVENQLILGGGEPGIFSSPHSLTVGGSGGASANDFSALPPEINSGRIYTGAGSSPLLDSAAAWDSLAAELNASALSYEQTLAGFTSNEWLGPQSVSTAAATSPYVAWLESSAAQTELAAGQARAAANAFESAFGNVVSPTVVAANRAQLTSLIATNFLGQNDPAITQSEAQYAQMWAQDAAAMYGYTTSSAQVSSFSIVKTNTPVIAVAESDYLEMWAQDAAALSSYAVDQEITHQTAFTQQEARDAVMWEQHVQEMYDFAANSGDEGASGSGTFDLDGGVLQIGGIDGISRGAGAATFNLAGGTIKVIGSDLTTFMPMTLSSDSTIDTNGFNAVFFGEFSGSGSLNKAGLGTAAFFGTSTYTGGTTLTAGVLQADNDDAFGTGPIIFAGGTLQYGFGITHDFSNQFSTADNQQYSIDPGGNVITFASDLVSQGGSLTLLGSGQLILSGSNTYTGGTVIKGGILAVANSAALGSGGVSMTGGTLTTAGNNHLIIANTSYSQGATATLSLNITDQSVYDALKVNGAATLSGTLELNLLNGFLPGKSDTFTVVTTTDPISGKFSSAITNFRAIGVTVDYSSDTAVAQFSQLPFANLSGVNYSPNQHSVAAYVDQHDQTSSNPGFTKLVSALNGISDNTSGLIGSFDQLSPLKFGNFASSLAFNNASFSTQQFDGYLANHRVPNGNFVSSEGGVDYTGLAINDPNIDTGLQSVRSRLLAWSPAPNTGLISDSSSLVTGGTDMKDMAASTMASNPWNVFVTGNVVLAQNFSDNAAGLPYSSSTTGAVEIGADYKVMPHWLVGAAFGYGHTHADLDAIGSNATINTYSPAIYTSYADKGYYVNGLASYGFSYYGQQRNVSIPGFAGTASSSPGGDQVLGNIDGGYDFHRGAWTFGPTLGLQYLHLTVDGYSETGLPGADLTVNQNDADSLRSRLGGQVSYTIKTASLIFTPHLSASWQHEFMDQSRGITSQFSDVGAGSFVVNTPNPSRDSALVNVGLDAQVDQTLTVFTDYSVQAGQSNYFGQSVQAGVKIGF